MFNAHIDQLKTMYNIVCKLVCLYRQLPMIGALLQGRAQFSFGEVKSRNYHLLYTYILGVLDLLQPHIFHAQHTTAFSLILQAYFDFVGVRIWP